MDTQHLITASIAESSSASGSNGAAFPANTTLNLYISLLRNISAYLSSFSTDKPLDHAQSFVRVVHEHLEEAPLTKRLEMLTELPLAAAIAELTAAARVPTLILAPNKISAELLMRKIFQLAPTIDLQLYKGDKKISSSPVVVTTYPSLIKGIKRKLIDPNAYGLCCFIEVPEGLNAKRCEVIASLPSARVAFTENWELFDPTAADIAAANGQPASQNLEDYFSMIIRLHDFGFSILDVTEVDPAQEEETVLSRKHQRTIDAIFYSKERHCLTWSQISSLLRSLEVDMDETCPGSSVALSFNGIERVLHKPHTDKAVPWRLIDEVRSFLLDSQAVKVRL
jgi:hypothetical protein